MRVGQTAFPPGDWSPPLAPCLRLRLQQMPARSSPAFVLTASPLLWEAPHREEQPKCVPPDEEAFVLMELDPRDDTCTVTHVR